VQGCSWALCFLHSVLPVHLLRLPACISSLHLLPAGLGAFSAPRSACVCMPAPPLSWSTCHFLLHFVLFCSACLFSCISVLHFLEYTVFWRSPFSVVLRASISAFPLPFCTCLEVFCLSISFCSALPFVSCSAGCPGWALHLHWSTSRLFLRALLIVWEADDCSCYDGGPHTVHILPLLTPAYLLFLPAPFLCCWLLSHLFGGNFLHSSFPHTPHLYIPVMLRWRLEYRQEVTSSCNSSAISVHSDAVSPVRVFMPLSWEWNFILYTIPVFILPRCTFPANSHCTVLHFFPSF